MAARSSVMALLSATLITAACGGGTAPGASSETVTTPPATTASSSTTTTPSAAATTMASGPSACADLGGEVGPDRVCTVHSEADGYTIDMSFPSDYPDQKGLSEVLTRQRDQFVEVVSEPPVRDVPKALDVKSTTYRSGSPESGTTSVVLEEYVNVGGAHPETYYDALNYDLAKQAPITLETLFKPGTDPVTVLDPIVETELKNRLEGAPVNANPLGADMYKNFALTDDAVIFVIGQGMWTIEAAGPQQVSVPRSELSAILA
ncbi:MAG: esterase [Mycobacterium sp.]